LYLVVENTVMPRGRYLAEFELYLLAAIARLGPDAYGMIIRREIEECAGRAVAIGAVYATLDRLSRKGYVSFRISSPRPVPGGRARKHVLLTPAGRTALTNSTAMLRRILPELAK
jgi:PadR family transcriptional regulator PadR